MLTDHLRERRSCIPRAHEGTLLRHPRHADGRPANLPIVRVACPSSTIGVRVRVGMRLRITVLLALSSLTLAACRTAALYNPPPVAFPPASIERVEQAIIEGMRARKWIPVKESPGVVRGTLNVRRHTAIVRVEYTASSYQIVYVDSGNLLYKRSSDGAARIHGRYNTWIVNLTREINARLP